MDNIGATLLKIGAVAFILGIFFVLFGSSTLEQVGFYFNSAEAQAEVLQISTNKSYCHQSWDEAVESTAQPCTLFTAQVQYQTPHGLVTTTVDNGSVMEHNQPDSMANFQAGDTFTILYDTRNPAVAHPQQATNYYMWALVGLPVLFGVLVMMSRQEAIYQAN